MAGTAKLDPRGAGMKRADQTQPTDPMLYRPPETALAREDSGTEEAKEEQAGGEEEEAGQSAHEPWALLCPAVLSALAVVRARARPGHGGFRLHRMSEPRQTNPSSGWRRSG